MIDIEKIKSLLQVSDEELRIKGLQYMEGVRSDEAVHLLVNALGDESWRVRKAALLLLVDYGHADKLLPLLINCLRNEDNAGMRNAAIETLERIGEAVVESLFPYIDDDDHDLRKQIVDILGGIGDKRATPYLIKALSDPDENVKSAAAENLGRIGDDEAVKSLVGSLKSKDLLLCYSALEALCRIGKNIPSKEIIPLLDNPLLRKASIDALGNSEEKAALPYLISGLESRSRSTKEAALLSLVKLVESLGKEEELMALIREKSGVLPQLVSSCLSSENEEVLLAVIKLMGWLESIDFIPDLLNFALNEALMPALTEAIRGIGMKGEKIIIDYYYSGPDEIKPAICFFIGEIGSSKGVGLLLDGVKSPIGHVRHSSASSLGKIGDDRAIPFLAPLLKDDYVDVQSAAVGALSLLAKKYRESVLVLLKEGITSDSAVFKRNASHVLASIGKDGNVDLALNALRDEDAVVRKNAVDALGRLGGEEALAHIILSLSDEDKDVRMAAAGHLGEMKCREGFEPLVSLLQDEDIWVKSVALKGLAHIGGEEAAAFISNFLNDDIGLVVIAALEALGSLSLPGYGPVMMEKMESADGEIVKTAIESLSFWNDESFLKKLILMLDHENWDVRASAASLLGNKKVEGLGKVMEEKLAIEDNPIVRDALKEALLKLSSY
ncbi:MAG: HEAT repeat domain-containing protein [Deltaproteobacteria bacterium]|nr:HEAT repeat domain-containing protein [Deltaproteobacteria bacterium]